MQELSFELTTEYIELNKLLKIMRIAQTGGHANLLISDKEVFVNGEIDTRKRAKIRKGDVVELEGVKIQIL